MFDDANNILKSALSMNIMLFGTINQIITTLERRLNAIIELLNYLIRIRLN